MSTVIFAFIKLFIIISFGFYFYKRRILKEETLSFLTFFVINFAVPFLIFSTIINQFEPHTRPPLSSFLLLSIGMFFLGVILGGSISFSTQRPLRREFISLVSFQNCGYLPMNIALFLLTPALRDRFLLYIFLYLLGFNVLMWSVGTFFIFKRKGEKFQLLSLFTPPILSVIVALLFVYMGFKRFIPEVVMAPLKIIGDTTFPLSMIILGVWLAKSKTKDLFLEFLPIVKVIIVKLVVIPAIFFLAVKTFKIYSLFGLFIILEASMPSAASLPIVANLRKANSEFVSRGVFFTHAASIITIPLWLELFLRVSGYQL